MSKFRILRIGWAVGALSVLGGCESKPAVVSLGGGNGAVRDIRARGNKAILPLHVGSFRNAEFHRDGLYSVRNGKAPAFRSMGKARQFKKKPSVNTRVIKKGIRQNMKTNMKVKSIDRRSYNLSPIWLRTHKTRAQTRRSYNIRPMYMDRF